MPICLRNLSAHPIVIPAKVVIGKVTLANQVPLVVLLMWTSGESTHGPQKDLILGKLNLLQGLQEWPQEEQEQARKLLIRWEHLFVSSDLDLGDIPNQTSNWTDGPDAFQKLPLASTPHLYNDMKAHLWQMMDIGSTWKFHSPSLVQWSKSERRMGAWGFALTSGNWTIRLSRMPTHYPTSMRSSTAFRGANGSPHLAWSLGTGRLRWMRRANCWPHSMWGNWDSTSVIECLFGLTNAPTMIQWLMETCFGDLNLNWCIIYLDDILIFLKDPASYFERLRLCSRNWNRPDWNLSPLNVSYSTGKLHTWDTSSLHKE